MINKLYIVSIVCFELLRSNYNHPPPPHFSASYVRTTDQIPAGAPETSVPNDESDWNDPERQAFCASQGLAEAGAHQLLIPPDPKSAQANSVKKMVSASRRRHRPVSNLSFISKILQNLRKSSSQSAASSYKK